MLEEQQLNNNGSYFAMPDPEETTETKPDQGSENTETTEEVVRPVKPRDDE